MKTWILRLFCCAIFYCANIFAGAADLPTPDRIISGTFVSGAAGYAGVDWQGFRQTPFVSYSKNSQGGFAYGGALGYRFFSYFAIEGGFIKLPTVAGYGRTTLTPARPLDNIGVGSWFGYALGRFYIPVPITRYFYVTTGVGVTYRGIEPKPIQSFTNSQAYYYSPIFSFGLEYDVTQNWLLYSSYFYILKYDRDLPPQPIKFFNTPSASVILFGVGYKFSI